MKKKNERRIATLLAIMMVLINLFASPVWAEPGEVVINELRFPDEIFRTYVLENFDTNKSGTLSKDELDAVKEIYLNGKNISSLKGVEYFTELKILYCSSNKLTDLDITKNLYMKELYCNNNQLTALDVTNNTELKNLYCHENQLTALNVSNNTALTRLYCSKNQLTDLDVSKNIALEGINCDENQLTALNVSNNTALQRLHCNENQLTDLDVTKNPALESLGCSKNQLTDLDVSKNIALEELYCRKNQLTTLDVSKNTELKTLRCNGNQLTSLDLTGNTNIARFSGEDQKYNIEVDENALAFDLTSLPGSFNSSKASGWAGGTVSGNTLTLDPSKPDKVTYTYDAGNGKDLSVRLNVTYTGVPIVPPIPKNPDKPKAQKPKRFEYDGTEKHVTLLGFDEATMELSGDIKKTDVGIYTLYVTPKSGTWSDGSTYDLEIEWEIMKANIEGNITHSTVVKDGSTLANIVVNKGFTFNGNKVDGTFTWTDGSFAALPDDTSVDYKKAYTWIFKPNNTNLNQRTGQAVLYPDKEFVVSFDTNVHGTAPKEQTVREGKQATEPPALTDDNFNFGGWYIEATCENEFDFTQPVNNDITLYAKWIKKPVTPPTQYTVTARVEGGHGTVTPTSATKNKGETVTLIFAPEEGYKLDTVTVNGTETGVMRNVLDITMDKDKTVVVTFKPITPLVDHDVNINPATHGTVTADKEKAKKGETVTLTITPDEGYVVDEISVMDDGASNVLVTDNKFTMPDMLVNVTVTFKEKPVTPLTDHDVNINPATHGTVTADKTKAKKGETVTLTITPDEGYEVDEIRVMDDGASNVPVTDNKFTMPDMLVNVTVTFKEKAVTPPTPVTVTITFDKNGGTGTMTGVTKNKGETFSLPECGFTPPTGKEFEAWQVDGTEKNVGDNILLNGDKIIKAVWKDIGSLPPTPPVPPTPDTPITPTPTPRPYPNPWIIHPGWYYNFEASKPREEKKVTSMEIDWKIELAIGISTIDREINGVDSKIKMDVAPYIKDGRTMLPIRFVAEALGFDVEWNRSTRTVVLKNNSTRVEIPVDTNKIIVNGTVYTSDVKPEIKNNRTMLPIANIARALGLRDGKDIIWNSKSKIVTIYRSIVVK